ncbi:hypothetical protein EIP91_004939 [Steccherinum ochraceum]|uniref:Uncharacterized protein n=1 Tax=Steccherinum ochraceum TaxID=92696 RepID=A0A4R0RJ19_9APHY|nr:hypothetical protein EIP91_004939 [Steccherinum ochraceum]
MVHRPADSRLLVNLLSHEKEYSKQLASLLDHSQASLTSFSAYASASSPPTSHIIVAIAGAFYGADEALRKYASAVDQWQLQLKALKEMEDGLGTIIRDREILVTRLIKASKNSKPPSRDPTVNSSSSNLSYNGLKHPEVQVGTKLSAAQTELQACEAHLANKEKELEAFRTATIRSGLQARCHALSECGWNWSEMGKEGLRALDMYESAPNGNGYPAALPQLPTLKPLPELSNDNPPSSDHSSIAPSQSASQIGPTGVTSPSSTQYTLTIGPAHSISEHAMPNGTAYHIPPRIAEEPGGSSAEEGDPHQGDVQVVENERFLPSRKRKGQAARANVRTVSEAVPNRRVHFPSSTSDTFLLRSPTERDFDKKRGGSIRRGSQTVFGSIAALFRGHRSGSVDGGDSPIETKGRWKTRTDRNLNKKNADSSDDEDLRLRQNLGGLPPSVSAPVIPQLPQAGPGPSTSRMRKKLKRGSVQVPAKSTENLQTDDRGWASEGDGDTVKGKRSKQASAINLNESDADEPTPTMTPARAPIGARQNYGGLSRNQSLTKPRLKAPDTSLHLVGHTPAEASLSRNSSMSKQSTMFAPAVARHPSMSATNLASSSNLAARRRIASLEQQPTPKGSAVNRPGPTVNQGSGKVLSGAGYPPARTPSKTSGKRTAEPGMNLMSIVEDVRRNRDKFAQQQDPNRLLVLPKAPPPVSELLEWEEQKERDAKQAEENLRSIAAMNAAAGVPAEPPTPTTATTASLPTEQDHRPPLTPVLHSPPDKAHSAKPLRSALRNASRSPSPVIPSPPLLPAKSPARPRPTVTSSPPAANGSAKMGADAEDADDDDTASISSYETGHEVINDEDTPLPSPVAPLAHDNHINHANGASDLSNSTDSTTTDANGGPRRQKSVRMSLPPTFSTTPPAIYEEDSGSGNAKSGSRRHEPWSSAPSKRRSRAPQPPPHDSAAIPNGGHSTTKNGWQSHITETPPHKDVWEDSSDEDEEYGRAKRMLSRFSAKKG